MTAVIVIGIVFAIGLVGYLFWPEDISEGAEYGGEYYE